LIVEIGQIIGWCRIGWADFVDFIG